MALTLNRTSVTFQNRSTFLKSGGFKCLFCISSLRHEYDESKFHLCRFIYWHFKIDVKVFPAQISVYTPQCNTRIIPHNAYFISIPNINTLTMVVCCLCACLCFHSVVSQLLVFIQHKTAANIPLGLFTTTVQTSQYWQENIFLPQVATVSILEDDNRGPGARVNEQRSAKKN